MSEATEISPEDKQDIDSLSRLDMARLHRFAPSGHKYFIRGAGAADYFKVRFKELGGFTPEISKQLGWGE